jgi:hypothetical protein
MGQRIEIGLNRRIHPPVLIAPLISIYDDSGGWMADHYSEHS